MSTFTRAKVRRLGPLLLAFALLLALGVGGCSAVLRPGDLTPRPKPVATAEWLTLDAHGRGTVEGFLDSHIQMSGPVEGVSQSWDVYVPDRLEGVTIFHVAEVFAGGSSDITATAAGLKGTRRVLIDVVVRDGLLVVERMRDAPGAPARESWR